MNTPLRPEALSAMPASPPSNGARVSPLCSQIRSKKTYFLDGPPMEAADVLDASGHCWCRRTQQALGPDGEIVHPDDCRAGRSCFQSIL